MDKFEDKIVLDVEDIQQILQIGKRQAYELCHSNQFGILRVGKRIKISKDVFVAWLNGTLN